MQEQNVIKTEEIVNLANKIANINNRINETLKQAKIEVDNLSKSWNGEASRITQDAVDTFADEYYDKYEEMIDKYVDYLKNVAAAGYVETEETNTRIGSQFMD